MISKLIQHSQRKVNLIFDFDKTIAQMEIDWTDWHVGVAEVYSKYDVSHGYTTGKDPHKHYNLLAEKHGKELIRDVKKFVSDYEQKNTTGYTPYVELVDFIKMNSFNNKMYIFSSNSRSTVVSGLKCFGILDLFEQIVARDDVSKIKPDVEGLYLLKDFEKNKRDYLMIGDSDSDEIVANLTGIVFLKCTYFGTYEFSEDTE
ncbi:HAD family hydrolase [Patescibacteria group bacterium]